MSATPRLPRQVIALGFVSLAMDLSSEMIHSLLPVFMISVIGVNALAIGFVEGIGEGLALIVRVYAGYLSDWWGKRKPLALIGYGLAALSKPLFALASGVGVVLLAKVLDRIGKGIRGAPRDALIADVTPTSIRGAAFGLRQSMDTAGAFLGPGLAVVLMLALSSDIRSVFVIAILPALVAVVLLQVFVREPRQASHPAARALPRWRDVHGLGSRFRAVLLVAAFFNLARFSEAFLVLRAVDYGLETALLPLTFMCMTGVYTLSAYPAGRLMDRIGSNALLGAGVLVLGIAHLVLARAANVQGVFLGAALWGLHMGLTQGVLSALVSQVAAAEKRGAAFGWFGLVSGAAALLASIMAGAIWTYIGAAGSFYTGAVFAGVTYVALRWTTRTRIGAVQE